jgi:hypothetical protein
MVTIAARFAEHEAELIENWRRYRDGGRVPVDDTVVVEPAPEIEASADVSPSQAPEPAAPPIAPPEPDPVVRAFEATRYAEELQRNPAALQQIQQQAQQRAIEHRINSIAGLTDHKKDFLREHPEMLEDHNARAVTFYYQQALRAGIPDDTAAMNAYILDGLKQARRDQRYEDATMAMDAMDIPLPQPVKTAESLNREVDAVHSTNAAASARDIIGELAERIKGGEFTPPRKNSIPVSAPVSREPPTPSGRKPSMPNKVTLTPEERQIARNAFGPVKGRNGEWVDLTNEQKERLYAVNKAKLAQLRGSGEYPEPERNRCVVASRPRPSSSCGRCCSKLASRHRRTRPGRLPSRMRARPCSTFSATWQRRFRSPITKEGTCRSRPVSTRRCSTWTPSIRRSRHA